MDGLRDPRCRSSVADCETGPALLVSHSTGYVLTADAEAVELDELGRTETATRAALGDTAFESAVIRGAELDLASASLP